MSGCRTAGAASDFGSEVPTSQLLKPQRGSSAALVTCTGLLAGNDTQFGKSVVFQLLSGTAAAKEPLAAPANTAVTCADDGVADAEMCVN